jgi:hypothetical protein
MFSNRVFLAHIHFSRLYFIHTRVHTNSEAMFIVSPLYFLFVPDNPHLGVHISAFTFTRFYSMKCDENSMAFLSPLYFVKSVISQGWDLVMELSIIIKLVDAVWKLWVNIYTYVLKHLTKTLWLKFVFLRIFVTFTQLLLFLFYFEVCNSVMGIPIRPRAGWPGNLGSILCGEQENVVFFKASRLVLTPTPPPI